MSKYDIICLLADTQGFPVSADGFPDCSSPEDAS